ncbi:MAG: Outer rane lipoprotein [Verrucomicrobiota bacterium]|jgi:TolA-binding protein
MSTWIKGFAAIALFLIASLCLQRFRSEYAASEVRRAGLESTESTPEPVADPATNRVETAAGTNGVPAAAIATNAPASRPAPAATPSKGRAFPWMGGFVASLLGLAGLLAWEISRWFSRKTGDVLLSENAPSTTDAEYEAAEAEWANGNPLEAVRMMREYLDKNPSEQYAAIRIAEIYEKDLHNYVAASLELEEVLTKRLSREKWGWTAIHLANLYSGKMNQPEKAIAWLERIISDYPETGAAKKARSRLGVPEEAATPRPAPSPEPEPEAGDPNLPKGFSSKKR